MGYDPLTASVRNLQSSPAFQIQHLKPFCPFFPCHFQETIAQTSAQGLVPSLSAAVERMMEKDSTSNVQSAGSALVSARSVFVPQATAPLAGDSHPDVTRAIYDFICAKRS